MYKSSKFLAGQNDSGGYEHPPEGEYPGRCFGIASLGTQSFKFDGEIRSALKMALLFEIPGIQREDRGRSVPAVATFIAVDSMAPRSMMRKALESWRGRPFTREEERTFDYATLVGVPVRFTITHRESGGRTYVNLDHFKAAGADVPAQFHGEILYTPDAHDQEMFSRLPPHLKRMVERSPEYRRAMNEGFDSKTKEQDDDIPF
mgnify:CR=1 FL=1